MFISMYTAFKIGIYIHHVHTMWSLYKFIKYITLKTKKIVLPIAY